MRTHDSKIQLWAWPKVQASSSTILSGKKEKCITDHNKRSSYRITKNSSTSHSPKKMECLAPWLGHVLKTGSYITL